MKKILTTKRELKITKTIVQVIITVVLFFFLFNTSFAEITIHDAYLYSEFQGKMVKDVIGKSSDVNVFVNLSFNNDKLPDYYKMNVSISKADGVLDVPIRGSCSNHMNPNYTICKMFVEKANSEFDDRFKLIIYNGSTDKTEKDLAYIYDITEPVIINVQSKVDAVATTLKIDYDDTDDTGQCSGLYKIEIFNENNNKLFDFVKTEDIDSCSGTIDASIFTKNIGNGNHTLTIKTTDRVGNSYSKTLPVKVDKYINVGTSSEFNIFDDNKNPITYCINNLDNAELSFSLNIRSDSIYYIEVDGSELGFTSYFYSGDCRSLGSGTFFCSKKVNIKCQKKTGESDSVVRNIKLNIQNADDTEGIPVTKTLSNSFKVDTIKPNLQKISNIIKKPLNEEISGNSIFLGPNAVIKIEVAEQSGISKSKSYLTLKDNSAKIALTSCNITSAISKCLISDMKTITGNPLCSDTKIANQSDYCKATLHLEDISGNFNDYNYTYVFDNAAPQMIKYSIDSTSATLGSASTPRYSINKDKFNFVADINELPAKMYVLKLINDSRNVIDQDMKIDCKNVSGDDKCSADVKVVTGTVDGILHVIISDYAGNYIEQNISVIVLEHDTKSTNLFSLDKPELLQKTVTKDSAVFPQSLLFSVKYSYINPTVKADIAKIVIDKKSCVDKSGKNILDTPLVDYVSKNKFFVSVNMKKTDPAQLQDINELVISCNVSILAIKDNRKLSADNKIVDFVVLLTSDPQSVVGKALDDKIQQAKDDSKLKLAKKLGSVKKILDMARKLCSLIGLIGKASQMMNLGINTMDKKCDTITEPNSHKICKETTKQASNGPGYAVQKAFKTITNLQTKFCGWTNCQNTPFKFGGKTSIIPGLGGGKMFEPQGSLVGSIATGCIPGIIDNLDRYKFIKCVYIDCLKNRVPSGVPIEVCERENKYLMCKYEAGQKLALIPFANILKTIGGQIKMILQNPLGLLLNGIFKECPPTGQTQTDTKCRIWTALKTISEIKDMKDQYDQTNKFNQELKEICKRAGVD